MIWPTKDSYHLGLANISLSVFEIKVKYVVEKILKDNLDSIPSSSPSGKIQIMGGKVCLRCKGKTLLGVDNKVLKTKSKFSLKVKVMGSNPGYLLEFFLLKFCNIWFVLFPDDFSEKTK